MASLNKQFDRSRIARATENAPTASEVAVASDDDTLAADTLADTLDKQDIKALAEKVFALLKQEARLDRERLGRGRP